MLTEKPKPVAPAGEIRLPRSKKEHYLATFTEDEFRDRVVIPLFERLGLEFLKDVHGASEDGKDCYFRDVDKFGRHQVYAVQTKAGGLTLAVDPTKNLARVIAQLETALTTMIPLIDEKKKTKPDRVLLCASGHINDRARAHIVDAIQDPRIDFVDVNELISLLDRDFAEFWAGVDVARFPYLRRLKQELLQTLDTIPVPDSEDGSISAPVTDGTYVTLRLARITSESRKSHGQVTLEPKFEQIPVHGILDRHERMVLITGDGGSGKTTALRRFGFELAGEGLEADKPTIVPVLLKASEVAKSVEGLVSIARAATARLTDHGRTCVTEEDLQAGLVVVMVDGLDELPQDNDKARVVDEVVAFHRAHEKCLVILTSREYAFVSRYPALRRFAHYRVCSIDVAEAGKIVDRFQRGKKAPKEAVKELLRRLQDVHGMMLTPMLVTVFLASADFTRKDIPPNITELFKKFTELMLGRWDAKRGLSQQYVPLLKDFLLTKVAFTMHSERTRSISLARCREIMSDELKERGKEADLDTLFDEAIHRSNLFRVEDGQLEFRHHLLQEFFAGRGVKSAVFFEEVVTDDWWRNPMVFCFGDTGHNYQELADIAAGVKSRSDAEVYEAAVTIGLALQACYMATVAQKVEMLRWVVNALSASYDGYAASIAQGDAYPLSSFLHAYLLARDSVASESMLALARETIPALPKGADADRRTDLQHLWYIVGLIESGQAEQAEHYMRGFRPNDLRLLLAIHLGCFLVTRLRFASDQQKDAARRICAGVEPKVGHLLQQVLREWRSMLLELRRGEVKAIEAPDDREPAGGSVAASPEGP